MQVSVYIAISLDGLIAREDDSLDWLDRVAQADAEDYGYKAFMATVDCLVMGRRTYDKVRQFPEWPFARQRVVVLTHRPLVPQWGEEAYQGSLVELFSRLAKTGIQRVYLDGGQAISQGLAEQAIHDMTLSIIPCLLGQGKKLFVGNIPGSDWQLKSVQGFASGLVQVRYSLSR